MVHSSNVSSDGKGAAGPGASDERGVAGLLAVATMSLILLGVMTTMGLLEGSGRSIANQLRYQGQAFNAATAGSVDALAWLQEQPVQPVTTYSPQLDLSATPPVNDTENEAIGIVRTYPVSSLGNVWGRYEVRASETLDVSTERGKAGAGTIWQFDSHGLIFIDRNDNAQMDWTDGNGNNVFDWGEPGEVVAHRVLRSEAQRLSLVLPAGNAAIQADNCSAVDITGGGSHSRVLGSNAGVGVACKNGTGSPATSGATLTGNPGVQSNVNPYNDSINSVFGVDLSELLGMASIKAPDVASLPQELPDMSLVVVQGDATFTTSHPLLGSGVLVVLGDLTIPINSESAWNGVIYTSGDYAQEAPSMVLGAVISQGDVTLDGGSDIAEVQWDPTIVQMVRNALGGYRFSRPQYLVP
jgi:hypothetical protein